MFGELPAWPASPGLAMALKAGCRWLTTAHRRCLPPAGRMPGGLASDRGGPHISQHGSKLPREELGLGATVGAREQHVVLAAGTGIFGAFRGLQLCTGK